ncbi:hypothetical protein BO78DRAFT_431434 [Aspergillus sclerotiicarbonarius CBS 121057]|uniref:Geranylgeranyl pyrophosphate synthetase n=1 Tax=Aspergillus sclerotiicarbonarius (strain CBS 121057 / IBT 28362) TaxID=1448318 RepID=A0A319E2T8_ASPSB|nr:hypothetical protein BO78DRAFT_431434 [Aspergillus sclerotiicarbonarius CBS 121057]
MSTHWRGPSSRNGRGRAHYLRSNVWRGGLARRPSPPSELAEPPELPCGTLLATINRDDTIDTNPSTEDNNNNPKITNCTVIASYNWLNRKSPTITVPGVPPAWTPLLEPIKLQPDSGQYFRDQNAARYLKHPFQPAVEAIFQTDPNFDTTDIDIVACISTLGNLLHFIRKVDKKFRMIVETVGTTVFFIRREDSPTQTISDVRGYGHTFPETYTTWDPAVKGSESHQRILRYNFSGMTCLVRFKGDGYLPEPDTTTPPQNRDHDTSTETLSQTLTSLLSTSTLTPHDPEPNPSSLTIQTSGHTIPQSAVFDLKTRSFYKNTTTILSEEMTRLWISQIPNFILAIHKYGTFNDIHIMNIKPEMQKWEDEHLSTLQKLGSLLRKLSSFALGQPDGRFEIVHEEGSEELEIREVVEGVERVLPETLHDRWVSGGRVDGTHTHTHGESESASDNASWASGSKEERPGGVPISNSDEDENKNKSQYGYGDGDVDLYWDVKFDDDRSDTESVKDFTACSAEECGYCGHCLYD